jgi:hypothetical protein
MKARPTQHHIHQHFVAEEVGVGLYRLFTSNDFRPTRGYRYRVTSAGPDIWQAIASFREAHKDKDGLITADQLEQFLVEQREHCQIERIAG